jgi:subtilisin family serine protease
MRATIVCHCRASALRVFAPALCAALLMVVAAAHSASAATLGPSLVSKLNGLANASPVGAVIVSFNTSTGLNASHLTTLTLAGVSRGYVLPSLGMVAAPATAGQVRTLAANPAVRSIWLNDRLQYFNNQTRVLTGVDRMRNDPGFAQLHQGLPVTGQGVGVLVNDSGIDATHSDLPLTSHVVQNVLSLLDVATVANFTLLPAVENVADTDTNTGHGTHCAGIVAGTGAASNGRYAGVAPGANLIGFGSGAALFVLNGLGGFEYALANQSRYNIRVISNSWGGSGAFDPSNPISLASKAAHDHGIVVVFAAGNSGPGQDTMGPEAKAPWVIGVAAGTKEGGLASFSSRGVPKAQRPAGDFNAPTITAPGTGREFAADSGRFTADVVSTRSKTNIFANGEISGNDVELAPTDLPNYTEISGTSMATPFVAGTVALMLSADPTLTPDEVRSILTQTASQMPGFSEFEVGAGYVNVYAAIDKVFHRGKAYGSYGGPLDLQQYNLQGVNPPTVPDIQGDPAQAEIELVLRNRMMDVLSDGLFHPASAVTRGDFAQNLVFNTALRQSLADTSLYTDTAGAQEAIAEAVTASGSTLRDYDFAPAGMLTASGSSFSPAGAVTRLDVAVALVKALGLDAAAQAKAGSDVTATYNGQTVVVSDESGIPAALRGYVQIALDRGILNAVFSFRQGPNDFQPQLMAKVGPASLVTRSFLAFAIDHYRQDFAAGN